MSTNPFPGPQPYRAADRRRFYGRDALVKKLANQVLARRATTLFGPSGAGKSSLMQAGVVPALEDSDDVRVVRVDAWPANEAPLPWLVSSIFIDFELGAVPKDKPALEMLVQAFDLALRRSDRPIIMYLDQLEQLFIAGHTAETMKELLDGLAWLIHSKREQSVHLILSLREDYLGRLRDWTRERPELSAHGFRVGPLTVGEMVKAMCRTAEDGDPPQKWDPSEIRPLMLDVRVPGQSQSDTAEVQSAFAQIVCRALWEQRLSGSKDHVRGADAEAILYRYLDTTLEGLGKLRGSAQNLLENHLVDDEGHRTLLTEKEAHLVLPNEANEVLTQLEQAAILHAEEHHGSRYFELGHDWLAKKVYERRNERKRAEEAAALEAKALAERRRFRGYLAGALAVCVALLGLAAVALRERHDAKVAEAAAKEKTLEAEEQRAKATKEREDAVRALRMAGVRELVSNGQHGAAALVLASIDQPEKARGWTQLAINFLLPKLPRITLSHGDKVWALDWSPDGKRLVTGSDDKKVRIWNADGSGKPVVLHEGPLTVMLASWSPDGTRILIVDSESARIVNVSGQGEPIVLSGHTGYIRNAFWSPDGKRILTTSDDHTARISNADGTGEAVVFEGSPTTVPWATWSPDGQKIAFGSRLSIQIWNSDHSGKPITYVAPTDVNNISWSPDGTQIASTNAMYAGALVWNANKPEPPRGFGANNVVTCVAWSPDGKHLAVAAEDFTIRVFRDLLIGNPIILKGHERSIGALAWSPDGKHIVSGSTDNTARIWKADGTGDGVILKGHLDSVVQAKWSPDGKFIATASTDNTVRVWDTEASALPVLEHSPLLVRTAEWSPDGKRIVTASGDKNARIWNGDGSGQPIVLQGHTDEVLSAKWSRDGQRVVTASADTTARVWNADGSGKSVLLAGHTDRVFSAQWSPDAEHIVTASNDQTARVWRADGSASSIVLKGHQGAVIFAGWSPNGTHIVTTSDDKSARVWNADGSGTPIVLSGHTDGVHVATWSPDGKRVATSSIDKTVRVWNVDGTGQPVVLIGSPFPIFSPAWSPDGKRVITTIGEHAVVISNADGSGQPVLLKGHTSLLYGAAWSPDGKQIATAADDQTARIWNADGIGAPLLLPGHGNAVVSVAWNPDGKRIVTSSIDGTARIWNIDPAFLQAALRRAATECLTPAQREAYLVESESEAKAGFEACEKAQGR